MNAAPEPVEPMVVLVEVDVDTLPAGVNVWTWFWFEFMPPVTRCTPVAFKRAAVIGPPKSGADHDSLWLWSIFVLPVVPAAPEKDDDEDELEDAL